MRLQHGTEQVNERSVIDLTVKWLDNTRALTTPSAARYRIDDITRGKESPKEILDWTTIGSLSTSNTITVTAAQNAMQDSYRDTELRMVTVEATRSSDSDKFREAFVYELVNLPGAA